MNPVDDGDRNDSDDEEERALRTGNGDEVDMEANDQRAADGEAVDEPETRQESTEPPLPHMPAFPEPHPVPRPRARGVKHPQVPTQAQIMKHALEQHVNYEAWCPHCAQASALVRQHRAATGESPEMPTVSADSAS